MQHLVKQDSHRTSEFAPYFTIQADSLRLVKGSGFSSSRLTQVKQQGSPTVSPLVCRFTMLKGVDLPCKRAESLDLARIVTKESTVLLKDIYNDIQSTLKKYDEIIRVHQYNRQKNESLRTSNVDSWNGSEKKTPTKIDSNLQKHMETLRDQQQLLILMLQNNTMQEQVFKILQQDDQQQAFPVISEQTINNVIDQVNNKLLYPQPMTYSKLSEDQANQVFKDRQIQIKEQLNKFVILKKRNRSMLKQLQNKLSINNLSSDFPSHKTQDKILREDKILSSNTPKKKGHTFQMSSHRNSVKLKRSSIDNSLKLKRSSIDNSLKLKRSSIDIVCQDTLIEPNSKLSIKVPSRKQLNQPQKPIIEIKLTKNRNRKPIKKQQTPITLKHTKNQIEQDISSIGVSPISNLLFNDFVASKKQDFFGDPDELWTEYGKNSSKFVGYAAIHNRKRDSTIELATRTPVAHKSSPISAIQNQKKNQNPQNQNQNPQNQNKNQDQMSKSKFKSNSKYSPNSISNREDVVIRNKIWKDKVSSKIRQQQELQKYDEMKHCTFTPHILGRESNGFSKIIAEDSTQSELQKDLKEIVSILDEFQEFKNILVKNLPKHKQT